MLIISTSKDKTINWPVKVDIPADGGKINKFEFTGTFKLLDDDEKEALAAEAKQNEADANDSDEPDNAWKEGVADRILSRMVGWKQVVDESKNPIDLNRVTLLGILRSPHGMSILAGINRAMREITFGAREKN
jgi:hypothetical protein